MTSMDKSRVQLSEVDYDPFAEPELARAVPTTDAQREVWLADQLGREASLAYNEAVVLSIDGSLNEPALQEALAALADRHESMRATFSEDGQMMLIEPRGVLRAELVQHGALSEPEQLAALKALEDQAVNEPFDLRKGPLFRATLVLQGPQRAALLIAAHHIVCDGWSFAVIGRELMALYATKAQGAVLDIAPVANSFGDYALADREGERSAQATRDERYWIQQFEGSVPTLDLPTDRPRHSSRGFASLREDLRLEPDLVDGVRKLGASQGVSLFASLFGMFAAVIGRLGGEGEAVVGVPAAGQSESNLDALVGHCVQLLPVRVNTDAGQSVKALLKQCGSLVLDAYDHQACTYGRLLSKLNIGREAGRLPLVSVQFNLDAPIPDQDLSKGGLSVSLRSVPRAYENFELFVNAVQVQGAVVLECQYNTQLFDAATVRRWLSLYRVALRRAVTDPQQVIGRLFAATDEDLAVAQQWNATQAPYPGDARIETLVAMQAARTPDAMAVRVGERGLSYAELNARANGLALALAGKGVGAGQRVGMACGRNEHMLVALLGILKTGAAYVPLDPSFPKDRLAHMQADAGLRWVVADRMTVIDTAAAVSMMLVEDVAPAAVGPAPSTDTKAAAYVIYTSGSTGLPKGVAVPQGAVVNFLHSMAREPGLKQGDRLVAITTISFDIAVLELFLPLMVGAEVILADRDTVMDGPALRALIERRGANLMQATPSGWRLLLDAGWQGGPGFKALVGGEALPDDLADELLRRTGETWNMYGPTETTVWSTCWRVPALRAGMRIGTPIANTVVRVLDEHGLECPIGVPGELCIGGDGVAIGYLNRPELTAERFMAETPATGGRLYRTGDRGRWRNDGTIEHMGRLDYQVKVRGYRIELGEIEVALGKHPGVARAVVITREDDPGDVRLVAYVVAQPGQSCDEADLRDHLKKSLPDYMIPSHLINLDRIPLLPNGKTDRKALPKPQRQAPAQAERVGPRNGLEAKVLAAMELVLNLPGLSVGDNFFAIGGHSLLAAKMTARINQDLGLTLPLKVIFEAPTAEQYAKRAEEALKSGTQRHIAVERQANQLEAPLTVMQERIRFMEQMYPGRVVYNTPSAHRLRGDFNLEAFGQAFNAMIRHQPGLRTYVADVSGKPVQRILPEFTVKLEPEDLSQLPQTQREPELMRRLQAIIDQPMDIRQAPLFRVALYRMAPDEHVLLFMPHHIIWDGWSFDLFYEEMSALYPASLRGVGLSQQDLPVTYVDFAHWHQAWMASPACQAQIDFWKGRFQDLEPLNALPTDRPRRPGMTGVGAVEWVHVDKALTERLRLICQEAGVTVNMLIMGVYAAMLSQALASTSLVVGVPVRGRLHREFESIMGFFNNLLPMPLRVDDALALPDWLRSIKHDMLDAMANQDVPFEKLASVPDIARHGSKVGLYQSLYSFQDARERPRHWGGLQHSSVLVMQKGATEDFGLWLMEVPGGLEGGFNYNADLFDAATAAAFRERLLTLLELVAEAPGQTLKSLLDADVPRALAFKQWVGKHHPEAGDASPIDAAAADAVEAGDAVIDADKGRAAEEAMAGIWASLLGLDASMITAGDNFFDLGGNSLLVMHAVTKAESELGLRTDPRHYLNLSLGQLVAKAAHAPEAEQVPVREEVAKAESTEAVDRQGGGLLSRLFGRKK
jgi:amino acid adenylation domain-containing protein